MSAYPRCGPIAPQMNLIPLLSGETLQIGVVKSWLGSNIRRARCSNGVVNRVRYFNRAALLIVDEVGYFPITSSGANLFFQLVNARYEKGAIVLTSNRGFKDWGEIFGDNVIAAALLDQLLHHGLVIEIEENSYRLQEHGELVPESMKGRRQELDVVLAKRPGLPRKVADEHPY